MLVRAPVYQMEILMNDINLFTVPALTKTATKQAQWGAEGMEEEEEEENVALADSVRCGNLRV